MIITIIGHFGEGYDYCDGQTVKTKSIFNELSCIDKDWILKKVDTHGGIKSFIKLVLKCIYSARNSDNVIILPAQNGIRIIAPLVYLFSRKKTQLHYIVVGGWLPDFLKKKKLLKRILNHYFVYVETKVMRERLAGMGIEHIELFPNFKDITPIPLDEVKPYDETIVKFCTFSRVMREKGIEEAVNAIKQINDKGRFRCHLSIYGPIDPQQQEWFSALQNDFTNEISYDGVIDPMQSVETIRHYYALLFPTYYDGEGFAGTLLDSFAAGVPVIASDWHYNNELVLPKITGVLCEAKSVDSLICSIEYAIENNAIWNSMKINCIQKAKEYEPRKIINILVQNMGNKYVG